MTIILPSVPFCPLHLFPSASAVPFSSSVFSAILFFYPPLSSLNLAFISIWIPTGKDTSEGNQGWGMKTWKVQTGRNICLWLLPPAHLCVAMSMQNIYFWIYINVEVVVCSAFRFPSSNINISHVLVSLILTTWYEVVSIILDNIWTMFSIFLSSLDIYTKMSPTSKVYK